MPVQLRSEAQALVDELLYAEQTAKRWEAVEKISVLPDKDQVEKYFLERLDSETNR